MRVRYTGRAFADLEAIRRYIEQHNPPAARRVVTLLEKIIAGLSEFPETGQRSDELDVRVLFATRYPYRIYYRLIPGEILILHIRHVARNALEKDEI
jgi:plasmid stabilization system protein ParE